MKKNKILKEILSKKKYKPLFGNNRSFSYRATNRKFSNNNQKIKINGKKYVIPYRIIKQYINEIKN